MSESMWKTETQNSLYKEPVRLSPVTAGHLLSISNTASPTKPGTFHFSVYTTLNHLYKSLNYTILADLHDKIQHQLPNTKSLTSIPRFHTRLFSNVNTSAKRQDLYRCGEIDTS